MAGHLGDEIAELFSTIIRNAAETKRKKPASKKDTGTEFIELPEEQPSEEYPYSSEDKMLLQECINTNNTINEIAEILSLNEKRA